MINIERNILCSILEHNFTYGDKRIVNHVINPDYFEDKHHKLFANGINRLRQLNDPIESDMLVVRLKGAGKWDFYIEDSLLKIISANPFGDYDLFMKYYKVLENAHNENKKLHELRYI